MTVTTKKGVTFSGEREFLRITDEELEILNRHYGAEMGSNRYVSIKSVEEKDNENRNKVKVENWPSTNGDYERAKFWAATSGIALGFAALPTAVRALAGYFDDLSNYLSGHELYDIPVSVDTSEVHNQQNIEFNYNGEVAEHGINLTDVHLDVDGQVNAHAFNGDMNGNVFGQIGEVDTSGAVRADVALRIENGQLDGVVEGADFAGNYQGQGTGMFTGTIVTEYGDPPGSQGTVVSDADLDGVFNEDGTFTGTVGDMQVKDARLTGDVTGSLVNGNYEGKIEAHNVNFNYYGKFNGRMDATDFRGDIDGRAVGTVEKAPVSGLGSGTADGYLEGEAAGYAKTTAALQAGSVGGAAALAGGFWKQLFTRKKIRKAAADLLEDAHELLQRVSPTYRLRQKFENDKEIDDKDKVDTLKLVAEDKMPEWFVRKYNLDNDKKKKAVTALVKSAKKTIDIEDDFDSIYKAIPDVTKVVAEIAE